MISEQFPELDRIRARFIAMLDDRLLQLGALGANAQSPAQLQANLLQSLNILHKIAGSAGTLGLAQLGDRARACEDQIICHLANGEPDLAEIRRQIDAFADMARAVASDPQ